MFPLVLMYFLLSGVFPSNLNSKFAKTYEPECRCVPEHLCQDDDVTATGQGMMDIRIEEKICSNYFDICCENPVEEEKFPNFKGCGIRGDLTTRITGDSETTEFAEFPWTLVLLRFEKGTNRQMYRCGASLIHPQVAMTAAHCVSDSEVLSIRAGEWNTRSREEPIEHQDVLVKEVSIYPTYHSGSLKNDIALLFLGEPVTLAQNVGIVCLPSPGVNIISGAKCIASGWGKDAFKKGSHSSVLKKIELPIVSRENCMKALRETRLGPYYKLHRSFICAGGEQNKDTCKGDGGSPLVCSYPDFGNRYIQFGIVAWGIGCGERNTPGVYANVALFAGWIDNELSRRNLDPSYYKLK